jgi:hypothetical protein
MTSSHPALAGRIGSGDQFLDIVYPAELSLDEHINIYHENEMELQLCPALAEHDTANETLER